MYHHPALGASGYPLGSIRARCTGHATCSPAAPVAGTALRDGDAKGRTNEEPLRQAGLLIASRHPDERVVIDATLQNYGLEDGGTVSKALRYVLAVASLPIIRSTTNEERLIDILGSDASVLLATSYRKANELESEFALLPLEVAPASSDRPEYAVYRVTRR